MGVILFMGLFYIAPTVADDPPYTINGRENAAATNANDQTEGTVVRFRVRPPPFAVEKAGNVGVYQCLPDIIFSNDTQNAKLGVKVMWKTPDHVPHLNQSETAWQEAKGHGYFIIPDNNSLVLVGLSVSDSGLYTCVLQHGEYKVEARMQLHVLYLPPYEFHQRALVGLLAMTLMAVFTGLLVGVRKVVIRYCWRRHYRPPHKMTEVEPSIQHT